MIKQIRIITSIIFTLTTITSCGQNDAEFPANIQTSKTSKHVRIEGTRIYGIMPTDFLHIKEMARYQKHDHLYVQFTELFTTNFIQAKQKFTRQAIEAKGAKIDILTNIRLNGFEAIYCEGPSKYSGETKLMLVFGDESFLVMIIGICTTEDKIGKKELQGIFKSIYYDKSYQVNSLELANFEIDHTITNFKHTMTASNIFTYTENGVSDAKNPTANSYQIQLLPEITEEKAEDYAYDLLWRYERNGIKLDNKIIKKTSVNNRPAFILEAKTRYGNKDGVMYQAVILDGKATIVFMASAYSDLDDYMIKFRKTTKTIKAK